MFLEVLTRLVFGIVPSCNLVQYQGKLMKQTWKNDRKPNFGPDFVPFDPNLVPQRFFGGFTSTSRHYFKPSSYAIQRKANEPNLRKWQKKLILALISDCLTQIWTLNFFLHVLPLLVVRNCSRLSSYII